MLHTESTIYHVQLNTVCRGFANKRGVSFVPTIDGMQALPAVLRIQSRLHLPLHPPLPPNSQPYECPWP